MNTPFDFWKDNQLAGHFTLNPDQLRNKFSEWKDAVMKQDDRGDAWYAYYYGERAMRCFITDKEELKGLSSVFDEDQFSEIYSTLKPLF